MPSPVVRSGVPETSPDAATHSVIVSTFTWRSQAASVEARPRLNSGGRRSVGLAIASQSGSGIDEVILEGLARWRAGITCLTAV
jgi:hypothetical protein